MCDNCESCSNQWQMGSENYINMLEIVNAYRNEKSVLIPLLQKVQTVFGYIPQEAVGIIAKELGLSNSEIYEVITFYSQFKKT